MVNFVPDLSENKKKNIDEIIDRVPKNEIELIRYFIKIEDILGFEKVRLFTQYPDASAIYDGEEIDIEFEKLSSNFKLHGHNEDICSMIICWENDKDEYNIPVLELATLSRDWISERNEAMLEFNIRTLEAISFSGQGKEFTEEEKQYYIKLFDKYDFDRFDALANYVGISRQTALQYSKNIKLPECIGGDLTCVKKDLEPFYVEGVPSGQFMIPVVLCCECDNKDICYLGRDVEFGIYTLFRSLPNRPKKTHFDRHEITNKEILQYLKDTSVNIWDSARFDRR